MCHLRLTLVFVLSLQIFTIVVVNSEHENHIEIGNWNEDLPPTATVDETNSKIDEAQVEEPGCPKIPNLKPLKHFRSMMGVWFIPYMSENWIRNITKFNHRKHMKTLSLSSAKATVTTTKLSSSPCIKIHVGFMPEIEAEERKNTSNLSTIVKTNKNLLKIHTKCPKTGNEFNLVCQPNEPLTSKWYCWDEKGQKIEQGSKNSGESNIFIIESKLSSKTFLVIRCFLKLGINWAIVTKAKNPNQNIKEIKGQIKPKIIKELLGHLHGIGFPIISSIIEIPYEKCV